MDAWLETGFDEIKATTGKSWVSISDAVDCFYTHTTKAAALPSLSVSYMLFCKHADALDAHVGVSVASGAKAALIERWHGLDDDMPSTGLAAEIGGRTIDDA